MAGAAIPGRLSWQLATVVERRPENRHAVTLRLALAEPLADHLPGQHVVVRLTAEDGFQAQRSYSIASAPGEAGVSAEIELTIERLWEGEVSPYLCDVLAVGDQVQLRGPIGGWFAWRGETPVTLIGGGSGVVPLMAMLRAGGDAAMRLLLSVRNPEGLYYADELDARTTLTYTREAAAGWTGATGRVSGAMLGEAAFADGPIFVCGGHPFCEHATGLLVAAGHDPSRVRVERFGPSG